jgi:peptide/nickel transport system permease protein
MLKYLLKRLFYAIFVLFGVATIVFFLTRMTGDPVAIMLPPDAGQAQIDQLKNTLGLDKPLIVQYGIYLKNLLHFDFGQSLRYFEPASNLLLEKLPATLKLALTALLISLCIAIPAGIIAALKKGSVIDQGIMLIVMAGQSMPVFWVGILLVMLFSIQLHWLPTGGYGGLKNMILPSIALGFNLMTLTTRLLRSSLIEVMETD